MNQTPGPMCRIRRSGAFAACQPFESLTECSIRLTDQPPKIRPASRRRRGVLNTAAVALAVSDFPVPGMPMMSRPLGRQGIVAGLLAERMLAPDQPGL